ncbi:MAG: hypothetical protein E6I97_03080 [Chloroflexi bacterium]|nr:MAG: hypothetical protein E6I97_03080 [Chloroflexota bacterium]
MNLDPDARADDGLLSVCLITANGPVKTIEQALSILAQKKLDAETTRYFRGAHFSIQVPASIGMQVDGSVAKLEELLHKSEQKIMQHASDAKQIMVNYRFDAKPRALQMVIPRTYSGSLFSKGNLHQPGDERGSTLQQKVTQNEKVQQDSQRRFQPTQKTAYEVTVIGVAPIPEKQHTYIVAGSYKKQDTDETEVFAVRIDDQTRILNSEGASIPPTAVWELHEGEKIVVEGDKTKRGVIRASCVSFSR